MGTWWAWVQQAQHETWFVPVGLLAVVAAVAIVLGVRIAVGRLASRLLSPRMRGTEDQVEAVWATEDDLVKFGLIKPRKRGVMAWMPIIGRR